MRLPYCGNRCSARRMCYNWPPPLRGPDKMAKAKVAKKSARYTASTASRAIRLLLVADSGTARILRLSGRTGSEKLVEVALLELPAAHLLKQEMVSDKTGRVFDRGRGGQGPRSTARHG